MARILIVQQDLPHSESQISTGGGVRAHAIAEGLRLKGHNLFCAIPKPLFDLCAEDKVWGEKLLWHSPGNLDYALKQAKPDIILLQWLGSYGCLREVKDTPIVIDLVAPRLLELHHRDHSLEWEIQAKVDALALGDFFICSNERQWYYFLPWLLLAGECDADRHLAVVPVSAPSRFPVEKKNNETIFLWGGVQWPWNNPLSFLNIVSDELKKNDSGKLIVVSGKFPYPYGAGTKFLEWEQGLKLHSRVETRPLLPYREMVDLYSSCSVAIDISEDLPERRLASPFRTKEYLCSGLPIITGDCMEISSYIKKYGAGWVLNSKNKDVFRKQVQWLLKNPDKLGDFGKRAGRVHNDHFTFEKAAEPLHRFCLDPRKRKRKGSYLNTLINLKLATRLGDLSLEGPVINILNEEEKELEKTPEHLHFQKGRVFLKKGDLKAAQREFLLEEKLYPEKAASRLKLCRICLYEGGEPGALIPKLQKLLVAFPGEELVRFELALFHYLAGTPDKAKSFFKEEVLFFGGSVFKNYTLGSELKKQGLFSEAITYFSDIVSSCELFPEFLGGSHFHLGEMYLELSQREKAKLHFEKCLKSIPSHQRARQHLAMFKKT
ncbi:MAG: glycosyltransferase [Nitrospinota bacterium]